MRVDRFGAHKKPDGEVVEEEEEKGLQEDY